MIRIGICDRPIHARGLDPVECAGSAVDALNIFIEDEMALVDLLKYIKVEGFVMLVNLCMSIVALVLSEKTVIKLAIPLET